MSTLITGGRIITAADDYVGDIFVDNEHIALIGESLDVDADRVIDADGQVRPARRRRRPHAHGHLLRRHDYGRQPLRGHRLGAFGGTTTIVDFAVQSPGRRSWTGLASGTRSSRRTSR